VFFIFFILNSQVSARETIFWKTQDKFQDVPLSTINFASLFNVDLDVDGLRGSVLPGQHAFPFAFMLPPTAPGSLLHRIGNYTGQISYRIEGICKIQTALGQELKSKQFMIVLDPKPYSSLAPSPHSCTRSLNVLGIKRGSITMDVQMDVVCLRWFCCSHVLRTRSQLDRRSN
jgi:hypothetical protein